jgi:putative addiction module component (TIGR02574 family)
MIATAEIERMSIAERLQAIELLWNSIARTDASVASPAWHQDVLSARRAKVDSGEGQFLTMSELRERMGKARS